MNLKKKSEETSPKATTTSTKHPKFSEMILIAIAMLNERNGSSIQAIKKYICESFNLNSKKISPYVKKCILMAVTSGKVVRLKGKGAAGSYRLGGSMKAKMNELLAHAKSSNKSKPASSSSSQKDKDVKSSPSKLSKKRGRKSVK